MALLLRKKSMYASVDLLVPPDGQNVQHLWCCNLSNCFRSVHFFQWNESEHVDLHIIIIIFGTVFIGFQQH